MNSRTHMALYGDLAILRGYCSKCMTYAFIIEGKLACCDKPAPRAPEPTSKFKRMCDSVYRRKGPGKRWKDYILAIQNGDCFYCFRRFG